MDTISIIKQLQIWWAQLPFAAVVVSIASFVVVYFMIPRIIYITQYKHLMDNPNDRSSHTHKTPTFAGVSFFVSLNLGFYFIQQFDTNNFSANFLAGLTILFFIGLKDDLTILTARTKIIAQLLAFFMLLSSKEIIVYDFHGFLHINKMPLWATVAFSAFIVLSVINAFNLIDGIDGLAGMVGIVIFSVFALIFYFVNLPYFFLISLIPIMSLAAFLFFNLSKDKKIFMGDTGSMVIGFVISILTLRFLTLTKLQLQAININPINSILLAVAILYLPFIDTLRVMIVRILNNKKPFSPDRNHIHHVLLDSLGFSHVKASIFLALINITIIAIVYVTNLYFSITTTLIVFILFTIIFISLIFYVNKSEQSLKSKEKIKSKVAKITKNKFKN